MNNLVKSLERPFLWLLSVPAILPVVVWGGLIYPYLVPKTLLFYAISFVAVGMFALLVVHGRGFFWGRFSRWEAWIPGALVVLAYVASLFGIDFYRSFWSTFERGDGLLMLSCVTASFYMILLSADRKFFDRLLRIVAVVGSAVALYGIGEWIIDGGRIGSLLGNAALFAGYLDIAFFATLAAAQSLNQNWRRAAYAGAAVQLVAIVLSATRGTLLALVLAGVVYLVWAAFSRRSTPEPTNGFSGALRAARPSPTPEKPFVGSGWARALLAVIAILGSLFFVFRADLARVPFAPIARVASISATEGDVANRLFVWKSMVSEVGKSPWLGVGAEHIDVLFNRFYDPTQISEQWFDRSHNAFLDYAAQYGIGGLLLYLALIGSFFTIASRFARRDSSRVACIFALLAGTYALQNFFAFDTVSSLWLLLALLAVFLAVTSDKSPRIVLAFSLWVPPAAWLSALMLVILLVPVAVRPALAAYDLAQAYKYQLVDPAREVALISHGIALGTYGDLEYGYQAYSMYTAQSTALSGQARVDAYQAARSVLVANFNRYPYDARTALYLAHVLALAPNGVAVDRDMLSSALTRCITESPKRLEAWFMLVNLSIGEANTHPQQSQERIAGYTAARDLMSKYVTLVPNLAEPHFVLAQLLYASSDATGAAAEAAKGKMVYTRDLKTAMRAVTYYETVLDLPDAAFFLKEVVRIDPNNAAAKSDLIKIQAYEQSKK